MSIHVAFHPDVGDEDKKYTFIAHDGFETNDLDEALAHHSQLLTQEIKEFIKQPQPTKEQ